jgi:excinuclease ABC subunit A
MGPEGGNKGGTVVFTGRPEEMKEGMSYTANYLVPLLK